MPKEGGRRVSLVLYFTFLQKKTRTHKPIDEELEQDDVPKTFVIKRGKIGLYLKELLHDVRDLMYPYTASKLKESKRNTIKDFIAAAGVFGVSHMLVLT